jgi:hypothetical protein
MSTYLAEPERRQRPTPIHVAKNIHDVRIMLAYIRELQQEFEHPVMANQNYLEVSG